MAVMKMLVEGPVRSQEPMARRELSAFAVLALLASSGCGAHDKATPSGTGAPSSAIPAGFREGQLPKDLLGDLPLIPPKRDLDIPLFSGIVDVQPGDDVTFCTFTDLVLDEATIFGESFGSQSPQGHHGILQYTTTPQDPHTGPCGAMDGQMLLGGTGGKGVDDTPTLDR